MKSTSPARGSALHLWIRRTFRALLCCIMPAATPQSVEPKPVTPGISTACLEPLPLNLGTREEDDDYLRPYLPEGWTFERSTYGWLPVMFHWKTTTDQGTLSKNVSMKDILDGTKGGILLHLDARKGRLGLSFGFCYGDIEDTQPMTVHAQVPSFNVPVEDSIQCGMFDVEGAYRFGEGPLSFDALAGLRYLLVSSRFATSPGFVDMDHGFIEPLLGGLFQVRFTDQWNFSARVHFSGFGVGSELTSDIEPRLEYRISPTSTLFLGYRIFQTEYKLRAGGLFSPGVAGFTIPVKVYEQYQVDIACLMHGPVLGITVQW